MILERLGVYLVEFGLGLDDGLVQHGFAVDGFLILGLDAPHDAGPCRLILSLQLGHFSGSLGVVRMILADARFDLGKLLSGVIQAAFDGLEGVALGRDLSGFQGPGLDGLPGGFLFHALGLGVGVFGVQLEQASGEDASFFLGVDDVQFAFELGQGHAGTLHFGAQLLELLFHEGGKIGGGVVADLEGAMQV